MPPCFKQTPNEFWDEYEYVLDQLGYRDDESITQARYVYDAVWMIALTLNQSIADIEERFPGQSLRNFTYDNSNISQIFIERMSKLTFRGVSVSRKLCVLCVCVIVCVLMSNCCPCLTNG